MDLAKFNTLLIEEKEEITMITLNTPKRLNALNSRTFEELEQVLNYIEKNDKCKVIIITGSGKKAFAAGADITELAQLNSIQAYENMLLGHKLFLRIHEFPKPVIAMVNGYALGGGFELALSCDILVASTNSYFGFPEITLNTLPGWGGTQLAPKKMGVNRAKEMILSGKHYSAEECRNFGFINYITSIDELYPITIKLAESIVSNNSLNLRVAKDSINRGLDLDIVNGFRYEAQAYTVNFSGPYAKEGLNNFFNKEKE